ncbi:hypothetical protein [Streptomyces sp. NPDC056061]|uniref:hypothetical protein n=1 Tax=Streptomyces sp. NPDC056061 TaxID=3345700 RepID=UPI0035DC3E6E
MTGRAGETFTTDRALLDIDALLARPLPVAGPTAAESDPETGEWTGTGGDGFRVVPLWEGDALTGVYAAEWNDAEDAAEAHRAALVDILDRRWGPHRAVPLHVPLFRRQEGSPVDPLFDALFDQDLYGDLTVWGPVEGADLWVGVSVGHSDGDAPLVLAALVAARPVAAPDAW